MTIIAVRHLLRTFQFQKCTPVLLAGRKFTTTLNEEQLSVQQKVKEFSKEHLAPIAKKVDKEGRFPFQQISKLIELGFMGACVEDTYGGLGLDFVSLAIIIEELSRGCASIGMVASIHNFLYANLLNARGTPEQKEKFLTKFTKGSIGCFALSEPGAGTDVAGIALACRKDGDHWIINGRKSWVTSAIEGSATIVFATFDPKLRHKGLNCFVVPLDAEGVFRGRKEHIMGVRAASASDVTFEDVRVHSSNLIGKEGEGFTIAMNQLDQGRIGISAHAVGIAQSALDTAINYGRTRKAFGKPLTHLPSVKPGDSHDSEPSNSGVDSDSRIIGSLAALTKNRLSEMAILVDTARLLTYRAASQPSTKNSAMAKYTAGVNAVAVANHCVQIMGGRGLHTDYAAERHYRDARGTQIYGGVTDIQKILVGHYLLKEAGMPTATHRNE